MDIDHQIAKFLSSQKMEDLETQNRIINLGKSLVDELGLGSSVDTLGRWIAHYIAEQMTIVEESTGDKKINAQRQCFEAILKLWNHRSALPERQRPFKNFDSIFHTLEKLNPDNQDPFYFRYSNDKALELDEDPELKECIQPLLKTALGIDKVVRIWLEYVFKQAATCATNQKTITWLENAIHLSSQPRDDISIIVRWFPETIHDNSEPPEEEMKKRKKELVKSRLEKLQAYNVYNQMLISILEKELRDLSGDDSE